MPYPLTKSTFMTGLSCQKALWLSFHKEELGVPQSQAQKLRFDLGNQIGERAREDFPDGVLLDYDKNVARSIALTREALEQGHPTLFEATFSMGTVFCRVDILNRLADGTWHLIEVKSSKRAKEHYIADLAVQAYVLRQQGLQLSRFSLYLLSEACVYPDLTNLFVEHDVSKKVEALLDFIETNIEDLGAVLNQDSEPDVLIGSHCKNPYACAFKDYCWKPLGKTIFHLPNFRGKAKDELIEQRIVKLDEIPADIKLTANAQSNVDLLQKEQVHIDNDAIQNELSTLQYPLYFFDFETFGDPIPRLDGLSPYEAYPFQYSCHVLHEDGGLEHHEYLHQDTSDPREYLSSMMLDVLKSEGSIIAYYATFEKGIIKGLAESLPHYRDKLESLLPRFWDQLLIFKKYYKHHGFMGSNSIKSVLPVIVPELSYVDLDVANGEAAQYVWWKMIMTDNGEEKKKLRDNLLAYCKLDTLAMVEIHKHLQYL